MNYMDVIYVTDYEKWLNISNSNKQKDLIAG